MKLIRIVVVLILFGVFGVHQINANSTDEIKDDYLVKFGTTHYKVPTTKLTLDALPFRVKMPTYLPFTGETVYSFKTDGIRYFKENGNIDVSLFVDSRKKTNQSINIVVGNFPNRSYDKNKSEKIDKNTKGYFEDSEKFTTLYLENNNLYYRIDFLNKDLSFKQAVDELQKMYDSFQYYDKVLKYN